MGEPLIKPKVQESEPEPQLEVEPELKPEVEPRPKLSLQQAIARQEGFYVNDSRAARNNNPGNIVFGQFARNHGARASDGRFAIFPSAILGFTALTSLLEAHYVGLTIEQVLAKWAPPVENDTEKYITDVCAWTGLDRTSILTDKILGL